MSNLEHGFTVCWKTPDRLFNGGRAALYGRVRWPPISQGFRSGGRLCSL